MTDFVGTSRPIVIRTSRETLGLVVAASAIAVVFSVTVHGKREAASPQPKPAVQETSTTPPDWTGRLPDVATAAAAPTPAEPMTSASLTVPKAQLALPPLPKAKPKPCAEAPCATARTAAPAPSAPHRDLASDKPQGKDEAKRSLVGYLNPMNHLPDMSAVGRPFATAGGAVAGWFKRL